MSTEPLTIENLPRRSAIVIIRRWVEELERAATDTASHDQQLGEMDLAVVEQVKHAADLLEQEDNHD